MDHAVPHQPKHVKVSLHRSTPWLLVVLGLFARNLLGSPGISRDLQQHMFGLRYVCACREEEATMADGAVHQPRCALFESEADLKAHLAA